MNQKLQIAKTEFLHYSDIYLEKLAVRLSGLKEFWAKMMIQINEFVNGPLIIYMEDFKGTVVQGFSNLKLQVNEYLAKKDWTGICFLYDKVFWPVHSLCLYIMLSHHSPK